MTLNLTPKHHGLLLVSQQTNRTLMCLKRARHATCYLFGNVSHFYQYTDPAVGGAPGMARHTGETLYLVDDNEPIILIDDIQGYVLHTATAAIACRWKRVHL